MKKRISFLLTGAIAFSSLLLGCSTDNSVECPSDFTGALVEEENVLVGTWELSAIMADKEVDITKDDEDNPKKDILAQYSACEKDADYTFSSNRAYEFSQGENASNCSNKVKITGTWKYASGILGMVGSCSSQNLNIVFNADKTSYSVTSNYTITDVNGRTVQTDVKFTYTKKVATPA